MSDEAAPEPAAAEPPPRYDILLVSQNRAHNVVEQGLKSIINYMQASGFIRAYDEAVAEDWTEVYAKLGPSAHELFVKGGYTGDPNVFHEVAIRGGTRPTLIPYGGQPDESCYFWIDIRGALFNDLTGRFKTKLKDVMVTRFDMFVRPHEALPPHAVVSEDELPVDKKKKKDGPGVRVGTAVEEF